MNTNKLLTFIIPVYNVEKYLDQCLSSLIDQSVMDHCAILVDDGSTDRSGEIADRYAKDYPDLFRVVHQENKGLGAARNAGMALIDTPFVTFLDSDDWQDRRFVAKFRQMIDQMDEYPDMVFTMPTVYDMQTRSTAPWKDKPLFDNIFEVKDGKSTVITNVLEKTELYGLEVSSCRKIYRTDFLVKDGFRFPEGIKWEDVPGHFHLLHNCYSVAALPDTGFFYRVNHPGQITGKSGRSRMDMIPVFNMMLDLCEKEHFRDEEKVHVVALIMRNTIWSLETTNTDYIKELISALRGVYARISPEEWEYFLYWISPEPERDRLLLNLIQEDDEYILSDYLNRKDIIVRDKDREVPVEVFYQPKVEEPEPEPQPVIVVKSKHQRLFDCLSDHGVKYTSKYFVKKYVLRMK